MTKKDLAIEFITLLGEKLNKKNSRNKMLSLDSAIALVRDKTSTEMTVGLIQALIRKKYIRYYKTPKGVMYIGLTKIGWSKWEELTNYEHLQAILEVFKGKVVQLELPLSVKEEFKC